MQARVPMTRRVLVVPPELSQREAWALLQRERIRHLPVAKGGLLLGIVSDRDLLLRGTRKGEGVALPDDPIAEAMTMAPFVASPDSSVDELVRVMTERKIDAIPILNAADQLVGLVTSTDLLLLLIQLDEAKPPPFEWELVEHAGAQAAYA
ncbi:MAG TPA: CBS domain-containing protein [Polyangiaceae bacterium LLY-WYZ-15_(1-7)]|nr:CBS domain-containing protein [Polyangiaceae bacterium LLY-WYZ-15_(1-7)]HJL05704.1 CBS domain-containing protein [Polyangiaceae bacterium LLY-WYZ-15_(1-7)]HJL08370.1 CBS domain-containing protein [Polyangiaceae bacterium LLY-WYZ-15_(1-7)]HJL26276.1 CBS domain-containing protein [Polyangiaceae bacterium LLY-WYZ-15_(1-7)]HJL37201.1 CBS domain-containing protein [Polyangiaceae bacterium LLY-WYZ-15_(1-7)]